MESPKLDPGSHGSPFADQLHRGFARLRFSGALLEKEFRDFYIAQNLPRARSATTSLRGFTRRRSHIR